MEDAGVDANANTNTIFDRLRSKMAYTSRPFPIETVDLSLSKLSKLQIYEKKEKEKDK